MQVSEILKVIDLGSSVAEFDRSLERYFVETESFRALVHGEVDVVAGDKGTGKTALLRILERRYRSIPELEDVEVVVAFNPSGSPVFQRLVHEKQLTEGQYKSVWKAYFFSLVGNWALNVAGEDASDRFAKLGEVLQTAGLRALDDTPNTIFSRLVNSFKKLGKPTAAEAKFTMSETGMPIVVPRVEFGDDEAEEVSHEEALALLNACLHELGLVVWVVMDRLDEAFQGYPQIEIPSLRALLRSYLDLLEYEQLRIKLFVRRDLFRKVIAGGFVNLTHINARKIEIVWEEGDLLNLLCQRFRGNDEFIEMLNAGEMNDEALFSQVFPGQVDVGARKPTTWNWIMARIRDGNQVKPPRNLIDLITKAKEGQARREAREAREYQVDMPIIEGESVKGALSRLSEERVEDTLLAEAGDAVDLISAFRKARSEHNRESLGALLNLADGELESAIERLVEIGFLEPVGQNFKVPMLYRDGLQIVQGKSF